MSRAQGHVKWFSSEKGYGFIERSGEEDVFVHHSEISMEGFRTLDAGEPVEFEIISGERGPKARNVSRMEPRAARVRANGTSNGRTRTESASSATGGLVQQIRTRLFGRLTKHA